MGRKKKTAMPAADDLVLWAAMVKDQAMKLGFRPITMMELVCLAIVTNVELPTGGNWKKENALKKKWTDIHRRSDHLVAFKTSLVQGYES
jgi:hypothetical protein